jgi:translation initiation factor 1A
MSTIKGGKKKRRGKNMNAAFTKPFVEPTAGQYFAKALKPLGSLKVQLEVFFYDIHKDDRDKKPESQRLLFRKQEMIGNVRGNMRKRQYVNPGDVVLVSERGFTKDAKIVDIVMKYPNHHHNLVKKHRCCPNDIMFGGGENEDSINFKDESEEDEFDNSDEDLTSMKYSSRKTIKKKTTNLTQSYYHGIDLPTFDDEFEDSTVSSGKQECDMFGNYI